MFRVLCASERLERRLGDARAQQAERRGAEMFAAGLGEEDRRVFLEGTQNGRDILFLEAKIEYLTEELKDLRGSSNQRRRLSPRTASTPASVARHCGVASAACCGAGVPLERPRPRTARRLARQHPAEGVVCGRPKQAQNAIA